MKQYCTDGETVQSQAQNVMREGGRGEKRLSKMGQEEKYTCIAEMSGGVNTARERGSSVRLVTERGEELERIPGGGERDGEKCVDCEICG